MQVNLVSWNPGSKSQFISYSQHRLHLLEFGTHTAEEQRLHEIKGWDAPNLACLEWRPPIDGGSVLAYGSSVGSVHLLNAQSGEEMSVSQGTKLGKRPCNAVSWNKLMPSQLLAGFDNLKSECCAIVWDFEHEHFLQTSFGESACSVSWLPDNAHSVAVGTSMGWVKVYDTRTSNQMGASCSIMAHPAPRPRKIRGIRPDPFRPHLFATYSDFPGDVVKVWDLRKVSNPTSKAVVPPSFIVVPSPSAGGGTSPVPSSFYGGGGAGGGGGSGEVEAVVDVAWSTARPGVLAVATSARKSVSFYSTATASGTSSVPLFSVCVPEPVQINGLSWQHSLAVPPHSQQTAKEAPLPYGGASMAQSSPLQTDRKSIIASMTAATSPAGAHGPGAASALPSWESFRSEEELRMGAHSMVLKTGAVHAVHATSSSSAAQSACGQPRLLAATAHSGDVGTGSPRVEGFAEVAVLDRIPLSISTAGGLLAVNSAQGRQVALSHKSVNQIPCQQYLEPGCSLYKSTDVCDIMRIRCLAGYSADAYANIDVLAEELDAVYGEASSQGCDGLLQRAIANTKAVYRTWVWMDRFESTVNEAGLTISNCGVQEVLLRNQLHLSATNVSKQFRSEVLHPVLGATVYGSEGRDLGKKLCGWIKMFGLGRADGLTSPPGELSRSSSATQRTGSSKLGVSTAEWDTSADDDLLEVIVDEVFAESFERAAAIALWHGRLDLAVDILRRAISQMEEGDASATDTGTQMPKILWDAPFASGYVQTVSLVAMCFAGYNFPATKTADSAANSPGGKAQVASRQSLSAASSASATWASMCKHVISQLLHSQREATGYLSAACHFLLSNLEKITIGVDTAEHYASIVNDARLTLEDRVAFACTYLPDQAVNKWLERTVEQCISTGNIEGIIVTGLSDAGISILQKYVDIFDDVQTVALLVSRVIDSQNGAIEGSTAHSSSSGMPSKEWVWLHEYRSVLNKWEMFIERAYLDVELGKRYRRKAAMLAGASGAGGGKGAAVAVKKGPQKGQPAMGQGSQSQQQKSKAGRVLYKLPVHSDYPHFYLRCGFCGASLPVDGMQNIRPEHLRLQNNVLHCCAACNKQLPRCYVCQLYMGMVNPYLELNRVMTQKRISADKLLTSSDSRAGSMGGGGSGGPSSSGAGDSRDDASSSATSLGHGHGKEMEHNAVSFGKWFFFCQHCRHGGHATCIDQWFGGTGAVSTAAEEGEAALCMEVAVKRRVCGVNGCDCRCVARL